MESLISLFNNISLNPNYLLSLPPEILVNEILPKLPVTELEKLCNTNKELTNICKDENLWKNKLYQDYPEFISRKPPEITFLDYYKILYTSRRIPIYYHGDIIGYIPFYLNNLEYSVNEIKRFIRGYFNITDSLYILYTNSILRPIAAYTSKLLIFKPGLIPKTEYIIIVFPEDIENFERFAIVLDEERKGSIYVDARGIILSDYSKIPIYGFIEYDTFYILWTNPSLFESREEDPRPCSDLRNSRFMPYIYYYLRIPLPNIHIPFDDEILRILEPIYGNNILIKYPRNQVEYFYTYIILGIYKDPLLCDKVKEALQKIGHYFVLSE
jgi:hypothetical protein